MHPTSARDVTLVLGGVRSGKSRYALQLAARAQSAAWAPDVERHTFANERKEHFIELRRFMGFPWVILARLWLDCSAPLGEVG